METIGEKESHKFEEKLYRRLLGSYGATWSLSIEFIKEHFPSLAESFPEACAIIHPNKLERFLEEIMLPFYLENQVSVKVPTTYAIINQDTVDYIDKVLTSKRKFFIGLIHSFRELDRVLKASQYLICTADLSKTNTQTIEWIASKLEKVRLLDIKHGVLLEIPEETLTSFLSHLKNLNELEMNLEHLSERNYAHLKKCCPSITSLKINLSEVSHESPARFGEFCEIFHDLRHLSIHSINLTGLDPAMQKSLFSFRNLRSLDLGLNGLTELHNDVFQELKAMMPNLRALSMTTSWIGQELEWRLIEELIYDNKNLEYLELASMYEKVDPRRIQALFASLPKFKYLNLVGIRQ